MQTWSADGTRQERTNWRDGEISKRHRVWGFNCPAVDLDFLMVEYNLGKPVGLVEYKHHCAQLPNILHPTYRALTELANIANLPFLLAFYWPDIWAFRIRPVNGIASSHFANSEVITEREYVRRLYRMRRLVLTEHLEKTLLDVLPSEEVGASVSF